MKARPANILGAKWHGAKGKCPVMAALLRDRILAGQFKPGDRLPAIAELQAEFATTKVTALRAIGTLAAHGYLRTEQRAGVFVTDHPPHVSEFAIAFPWGERHAPSRFYRAIQSECEKLQDASRKMSMFFDIAYSAESADMRRLKTRVVDHRLAGIIFAHNPYMLEDSVVMQESIMPHVYIAAREIDAKLTSVYPDLEGFWDRALARLAARGRRRVAVLMISQAGTPDEKFERVEQRCSRHGLTTRPEWVHGFSVETAAWTKPVCRLLFQTGGAEQPDALLIADDNFVAGATAGVAASGIKVLRDLDIVAMANFPHPTTSQVPVERLGFDITRLVATCMDLIGQKRCGEKVPAHTAIPAVFEEEFGGTQ